ncbi:CpsD/CapB family tyrosine-protein kinase [Shimia biformata]|uniref:CpsD/CapB family tyrosine-protein kinase n=1 Tax=Shimia biformata TaxID=1294299 RepID=UPI0019511C8A|nr:CpsD/CapB family tyrosine-protein kinase [Shimia biformata]
MTKDNTRQNQAKPNVSKTHLPVAQEVEDIWRRLTQALLNDKHLTSHKVVSATRTDPANLSFDMLRTRLRQAMADRGWTRVAVTAPTSGCGTSFVASNLALAMSRFEDCRTVLMDLDLRKPSLDRILGVSPIAAIEEYLAGRIDPMDFFQRARANLALGLNNHARMSAAELFQDVMTTDVLDEMSDILSPEIVIFDMPAALEHDDLLAFLPNVDGVLLVAGAGVSTADDVLKAERLIGDVKPLMGVVLNRAEGAVKV